MQSIDCFVSFRRKQNNYSSQDDLRYDVNQFETNRWKGRVKRQNEASVKHLYNICIDPHIY